MPELPEVETIKNILEPQLIGKRLESVQVFNGQIIAHPEVDAFTEQIAGQAIKGMSRRGKYLMLHFESRDCVVLHLRMTGQLLVTPKEYPIEKHTHLIADLSGGSQLRYIDVRRFGRFWYFKSGEEDIFTGIDILGVEPLGKDLTGAYLKQKLKGRKKTIKEMLHDQSVIAGIGNIYSDEILFGAGIYPGRKCSDLEDEEWERLAKKVKEIIAWGIDANEMTPEEYLAGKGKEYCNIPHLRVYGCAGKKCNNCGSAIEKITVGGRSSCYCPVCQKK